MALHTHTTIRIKGQPGLADTFAWLDLTESITDHHRFRLGLPARQFGAGGGTESWRALVGRRITIEVAPPARPTGGSAYQTKMFTGLITGLELGKAYGPSGIVTLTGGAPTLLLEDDPHTQSYSARPLGAIARDQLGCYAANVLRPQVQPQTTRPLDYVVQYKETTWAFLRRLARIHGEWFYYDGQQVVFGRRTPQTIGLTHDVGLDNFSLQMGIGPANGTEMGYDYGGDTTAAASTSASSGLGPYAQAADDAGRPLFARTGKVMANHPLNGNPSDTIQKDLARRQAAAVADLVHMRGESHHPGLGVGNHISVEERLYGKEAYGAYMLTEVHHRCSSDGNYHNTFCGVPVEAAAPPHRLDDHPVAETQSAVVVDNNDPEDLGRVQVQLRWQDGRTPWLRMTGPAGGAGKGVYMIPEKGEEVMVGFAGGHPERPYVLGTTWNGGGPSGFGTPRNDIKAIKTRSGHTIELNDAEGKEFIKIIDKKNNTILIDTAESNIDITANETVTVNAKNLKFNISKNMEVSVGKNKQESIGEKHSISVKNSVMMVDEAWQMQAKEVLNNAKKITLNSTEKDMELTSAKKVISNSAEKNILN